MRKLLEILTSENMLDSNSYKHSHTPINKLFYAIINLWVITLIGIFAVGFITLCHHVFIDGNIAHFGIY